MATDKQFCFVESERNKKVMLKDGYRFNLGHTNKSGTTWWRCKNRKYCRGSITLNENMTTILRETDHFCEPDPATNIVSVSIDNCKQRVRKEFGSVKAIYENCVEHLTGPDSEYVDDVPKYQSVKNSLYRARYKHLAVEKSIYKKLEDVILPEELRKDFIVFEDGSADKILIFMTPYARQVITKYTEFFFDGVFKQIPEPFTQLYTMHADIGSSNTETNVVPVVFCLLPNKREDTYLRAFALLQDYLKNTKKIHMDYELGAINAARKAFPNAQIVGCFFHFRQCLLRKAKELSINITKEGRKHVAVCASMAFLPKEYFQEAWLSIADHSPSAENYNQFNSYMVETWLNIFENYFSCYNERHRTINPVESWHNRLRFRMNLKRKDLYYFVSIIKREALHADFRTRQTGIYIPAKNRTRRSILLDKRITKLVSNFMIIDLFEEHGRTEIWDCLSNLSLINTIRYSKRII